MKDRKKALTDMMSDDEKSGLYIDKFKKESKEIFDNEVKPQIERAMKMKKETLEEAAENFANSKEWMNGGASNWVQFSFKKGAKWQAERMYSEEEVLNLLDWLNNGFMLRRSLPSREELISWFEQFKKK